MIRFVPFFLCMVHFALAQDSLVFVIRVDDIQSRNTTYIPKSINAFQTAVEQRGGKVSWLAIPHRIIEAQNADGALVRDLKESVQRGHEIDLHGYNHTCPVDNNTGHEMFCSTTGAHIGYAQQAQLITDGLALLRDSLNVVPKLFVSPGHHEDSVTYQALLDKGFRFISTTAETKKYVYKNLFNLRQHAEYTWQMTTTNYTSSLRSALSAIRSAALTDKYFCILHHDPFIRQGYADGIVVQWMGELLDSVNLQFNGKVKYMTLSGAAEYFRSQVTDVSNEPVVAESFTLYQNFPNPFNPVTSIKYRTSSLSASWRVRLVVYDLLGREVATLVNEEQASGDNAVSFNAAALPSGTYLYELRVNDHRTVKKMIVLR